MKTVRIISKPEQVKEGVKGVKKRKDGLVEVPVDIKEIGGLEGEPLRFWTRSAVATKANRDKSTVGLALGAKAVTISPPKGVFRRGLSLSVVLEADALPYIKEQEVTGGTKEEELFSARDILGRNDPFLSEDRLSKVIKSLRDEAEQADGTFGRKNRRGSNRFTKVEVERILEHAHEMFDKPLRRGTPRPPGIDG